MKPGEVSPEDMSAAQDDLGAFARLVGRELMWWQLAALQLVKWMTCLVAPRQAGKSWSLATLACWWAFRRPDQEVLVISSVESSALRLLEAVRRLASHPLLAGSVDDDFKTRVTLSNGSRIESVTATQKQIRGASIDLLIIDEAAWIDDDVLGAAAIPTTAARPEAKVVVASAPWASSGVFYDWAMDGMDPDNAVCQTFTWSLGMAPWIVPQVIEAARRTLPRAKFEAEYEGKWIGAGGAFFAQEDISAALAPFPMTRDGQGRPGVLGLDWGYDVDLQAAAICGVLDDGGTNGRPVVVVPWVETSRRGYGEQEDEAAALAGMWSLDAVMSEAKGVGIPPTQNLKRRLRARVVAVKTSQEIKEQAYARLQHLLAERSIVLPDHAELRKQLAGIVAKPTPMGGLTIGSRTEAIHDDICDALAFAVWGLPDQLADPSVHDFPAATQWAETPGGIRIPLPVATVRAELSYGSMNGQLRTCANCGLKVRVASPECKYCRQRNPEYAAPALKQEPVAAAVAQSVPAGNRYMPDGMLCPQGHLYDGAVSDECPRCNPGSGGSRMQRPGPFPDGGLPPGLAGRLGPFLGPGR